MFTFRLNVIEYAREKNTKMVQREMKSIFIRVFKVKISILIDLSKKVCLRAYLSIDKTDESN